MSHFMQYYNYTFTHKCGTHVDLISIINQESLFYKKKIWKNSLFISFTEINDHRGTELLVTFVALFTKLEIKSLLIRRNNIVRCFKRIFKLAWCRENTRSIKMWKNKTKKICPAVLQATPPGVTSLLYTIPQIPYRRISYFRQTSSYITFSLTKGEQGATLFLIT